MLFQSALLSIAIMATITCTFGKGQQDLEFSQQLENALFASIFLRTLSQRAGADTSSEDTQFSVTSAAGMELTMSGKEILELFTQMLKNAGDAAVPGFEAPFQMKALQRQAKAQSNNGGSAPMTMAPAAPAAKASTWNHVKDTSLHFTDTMRGKLAGLPDEDKQAQYIAKLLDDTSVVDGSYMLKAHADALEEVSQKVRCCLHTPQAQTIKLLRVRVQCFCKRLPPTTAAAQCSFCCCGCCIMHVRLVACANACSDAHNFHIK